MSVAALILAAGESRRLGRPKQLIVYQGETLLNRAIRISFEAGASPVVAVLGSRFDEVRASIASGGAITVQNDRWRQGMGRSVETGMRALGVCAPGADAVLLMGCDQPRLTPEHLRALMNAVAGAESAAIAASSYAGIHGVPAVFPRAAFDELRALRGEKGARSIIDRGVTPVVAIEFQGGEVDIDAPGDLARLAE